MFQTVPQLIRSEPIQVGIELLVIWGCIYLIFRFLQGTHGAGIVKGFAILLVVATLIFGLLSRDTEAFARLAYIYQRFIGLAAIMLIVVFQPELRQGMMRLGHAWSFRASKSTVHDVIDAVAEAVQFLSKSQFGALIAIERRTRLGGVMETGTPLDAKVSARLLESIFWPNSPLHDLGVIIRGDRVVAASVQFPLAEEGVLPARFGSRHRAAVGLSVESDAIVVIVSEETGGISIAEAGRLDQNLPRDEVAAAIARYLAAAPTDEGGGAGTETARNDEAPQDSEEQPAAA